jgi:hypothetical protein
MLENIIISFFVGLISSFIICESIYLINKAIKKYQNWQYSKDNDKFIKEVEAYHKAMNKDML